MKITQPMLKKWIDIPQNILEITNQNIIEVESFLPMVDATKLTVGHVLTCEKHENSDHLSVTTVDIGHEVLQIICGAPNVKKGQYVIVALVGAVLPGNFEIKKAKIRGVDSSGMICSLNELGLEEKYIPQAYQGGIFYFTQDVKIGGDPLIALGMEGFVLELGLTPNRSDLLSVFGFAHDLGAMINQSIKPQIISYQTHDFKNPYRVKSLIDANPLYHAAYVKDVVIKESPWWLKSALIANNIKPINNVVDISNYVLLEYGTPLHMFDADKLKSKDIIIQYAKQGAEVITLDEEKQILDEKDIVITNSDEVIAVGGVMGCFNTMIDEHTKDVLVEAAYFDPKHIQKTSKRLNLRSDSSLRFERGVDPNNVYFGLKRALELLVELAQAKVSQDISVDQHHQFLPPQIKVTQASINDALGTTLTLDEIKSYLYRYRFEIIVHEDHLIVMPPSHRNDIFILADVVEEVARMHGLNHIPLQKFPVLQKGGLNFKQKRLRAIRHALADFGLNEIISYSLLAEPDVHTFQNIGEKVSILMPLSEDKKVLRQSLVHGLLQTVKYNQARQTENIALFEVGHIFAQDIERLSLGMALSQTYGQNLWQKTALNADFYVLKGILDRLLSTLGVTVRYEATDEIKAYHPYRQAKIIFKEQPIGYIAQVHQHTTKAFDIEQTVVLELDLTHILNEQDQLIYQPISKYPTITRDLSIVLDEALTSQSIIDLMLQTGRPILKQIDVFDVYLGSHIEKGKKSMAFRLLFNDMDKTLNTEDVDKIMKKIINRLDFEFKASIRV